MPLKLQLVTLLSFLAHEARSLSIGQFGVSVTTASLADHSRPDPFDPSSQAREVMISTFRPAADTCSSFRETPYMPPNTARFEGLKLSTAYGLPANFFSNLTMKTASPSCKVSAKHNQSTILFSPALGTSRHFYNILAATLASHGHEVVTIDHPYDVDVVEFPNGTLVYGLDFSDAQIPLLIETRALDIRFVLDTLRNPLPGAGCGRARMSAPIALAYGHSLGGAAALVATAEDSRLRGAVNMDGSVIGGLPQNKSVTQPVLFFGHEGKNLTTDETWASVWPSLSGWRELITLERSQHYTFSDLPALVASLGLNVTGSDGIQGMLGSIEGKEALETVTGVLESFSKLAVGAIGAEDFSAVVQGYSKIDIVES